MKNFDRLKKQNLTDLKYDKAEGKKAINTASKNILMEK